MGANKLINFLKYGRLIMEGHLGRSLTTNECVHHMDGDFLNNSVKNLQVVSRDEHMKFHPHSEEVKGKIRKSLVGYYSSEEVTRKVSETSKRIWEERRRKGTDKWGKNL